LLNKKTLDPIIIQWKNDYHDDLNMGIHKNSDISTARIGHVDTTNTETIRKVGMRPKKVPVTRSKDFLW
jgi:hypothetical protein